MPHLLDTASSVHRLQIAAVTDAEDGVVRAIASVARLRGKALAAPEFLSRPLGRVIGPIGRVVRSPSELAVFIACATRDWVKLQLNFELAIINAWAGEAPPAPPVGLRSSAVRARKA